MQVTISVCILVYKSYRDVIDTIKSIESNTESNTTKKIYIVDNSPSESDGIDELKGVISQFEDVVYLHTGENLGFGRGHNYILDKIDSKYHAIVNPDILLEEDALTKIVQFMEANEDYGMVIPKLTDENGVRQLVYRKNPTVFDMFIRMFCGSLFSKRQAEHTMQNEDYTRPFYVPFGQGSFLAIRTELFKKLNGFDDGYFMYLEDADLCRRVNQESKLIYCPEATVIHKWEKGSHRNMTLFKYHVNSMIYYFKKWGWKMH